MKLKRTITTYEGLIGSCRRLNHNPSSPFVDENVVYDGKVFTMPQTGTRFRCGSLDTNIVAKIVKESGNTTIFETLSGSIYEFIILEHGKVLEEDVELNGDVVDVVEERVNEYLAI